MSLDQLKAFLARLQADEALKQEQLAKTGKEAPLYGLHHIGLEVDNMLETAADLKAKKVEFIVGPKEMPSGVWIAFIRCPDGAMYELIQKSKG